MFETVGSWIDYRKRTRKHFLNQELKVLRKKLPDGIILDLMCGPGMVMKRLARSGFIGLDFSKRMLEISKLSNPAAPHILGNAFNLPFKANSFEGVCCLGNSLPIIPGEDNRMNILKEANRVLKKGGILLLSYGNHFGIRNRTLKELFHFLKFEFVKKKPFDMNREHKGFMHFYTRPEIKEVLSKAGFSNIDFETPSYRITQICSCVK